VYLLCAAYLIKKTLKTTMYFVAGSNQLFLLHLWHVPAYQGHYCIQCIKIGSIKGLLNDNMGRKYALIWHCC
jgi:hypothetical protein